MDVLDKCQTVIVQLPAESVVYEWLRAIHDSYRPIHTYVSIMLCALGTICNFCNIVVLTRKTMRTPVNMILTAMACCDTVVLFSNLIYTTHYTFVAFTNCHPKHWSYGWAMFLIAHAHLSLVGHSSSVWLSVMLALIRYLTLRRRGKMTGIQIDLRHSYMAIAFVVLFVSLMNAPNFLTYKIMEMGLSEACGVVDESVRNASAYVPGVSDLAVKADCLVFRMAFWISGTVFKVFPCFLLTVLVSLLTRILNEVKENRQRLLRGTRGSDPNTSVYLQPPTLSSNPSSMDQLQTKSYSQVPPVTAPSPVPLARTTSLKRHNGGAKADRTTRMLLAIVCVFLITELPQGIMAVLSGMFSEEFRMYIYNNMGDILDLLSLCGACTSFIIYCSMSGQFRNEFRRVFIPARMKCWFLSSAISHQRHCNRCSADTTCLNGTNRAYNTNSSYLRAPYDNCNGNSSCFDKSITMSLVGGSATSVRKVYADSNVGEAKTSSLSPLISTSNETGRTSDKSSAPPNLEFPRLSDSSEVSWVAPDDANNNTMMRQSPTNTPITDSSVSLASRHSPSEETNHSLIENGLNHRGSTKEESKWAASKCTNNNKEPRDDCVNLLTDQDDIEHHHLNGKISPLQPTKLPNALKTNGSIREERFVV